MPSLIACYIPPILLCVFLSHSPLSPTAFLSIFFGLLSPSNLRSGALINLMKCQQYIYIHTHFPLWVLCKHGMVGSFIFCPAVDREERGGREEEKERDRNNRALGNTACVRCMYSIFFYRFQIMDAVSVFTKFKPRLFGTFVLGSRLGLLIFSFVLLLLPTRKFERCHIKRRGPNVRFHRPMYYVSIVTTTPS